MIKDLFAVFDYAAVNEFHGKKKIAKNKVESYSLYIPDALPKPFKRSPFTTSSFCNWTIYKTAEFIKEEKLDTKLSFLHIHANYLLDLMMLLKENNSLDK